MEREGGEATVEGTRGGKEYGWNRRARGITDFGPKRNCFFYLVDEDLSLGSFSDFDGDFGGSGGGGGGAGGSGEDGGSGDAISVPSNPVAQHQRNQHPRLRHTPDPAHPAFVV